MNHAAIFGSQIRWIGESLNEERNQKSGPEKEGRPEEEEVVLAPDEAPTGYLWPRFVGAFFLPASSTRNVSPIPKSKVLMRCRDTGDARLK